MPIHNRYFPGSSVSSYLSPGERVAPEFFSELASEGGGLYIIWLSDTHFYGGRTSNFKKRWAGHLNALRSGGGNKHARAVFRLHDRFDPKLLECILDPENRVLAEQMWLDENVGRPGCVNKQKSAEGGGPPPIEYKHTPEAKAKISLSNKRRPIIISQLIRANKGRSLSASHREKLSAVHMGMVFSEDHKRKISEALKGVAHTAERTEKVRAALTGRAQDPEHTRKSALANTGKKRSLEALHNISVAQKGKTLSAETKKKISDVRKGAKASPEARARMSETARGRKHSPETIEKMRLSARRKKEISRNEEIEVPHANS